MNRTNRLPASSLLVSGDVRAFHPMLAAVIGLNEAIVLQQLYFWLERTPHVIDGRPWVYNTLSEWREQLPWLSERTLRRVFDALIEEHRLVLVANHNRHPMDRTRWYTIDFEQLDELLKVVRAHQEEWVARAEDRPAGRGGQIDHMEGPARPDDNRSDWPHGAATSASSLTETTTETPENETRPRATERESTLATHRPAQRRLAIPLDPPSVGDDAAADGVPRPAADVARAAAAHDGSSEPPGPGPTSPTDATQPAAVVSRYTAQPGDALPYLALAEACRHPRAGVAIQDPRTAWWWRYEGTARDGVWRRMPATWHPGLRERTP